MEIFRFSGVKNLYVMNNKIMVTYKNQALTKFHRKEMWIIIHIPELICVACEIGDTFGPLILSHAY